MKKIEILGKSDCQPCQELKMILDMQGKVYEFYDATVRGVARALEMKNEMAEKGVRTIPAVWIDNNLVGAGKDLVLDIKDYL